MFYVISPLVCPDTRIADVHVNMRVYMDSAVVKKLLQEPFKGNQPVWCLSAHLKNGIIADIYYYYYYYYYFKSIISINMRLPLTHSMTNVLVFLARCQSFVTHDSHSRHA